MSFMDNLKTGAAVGAGVGLGLLAVDLVAAGAQKAAAKAAEVWDNWGADEASQESQKVGG